MQVIVSKVAEAELWMHEARERCIVGDHRRNATTTPHKLALRTLFPNPVIDVARLMRASITCLWLFGHLFLSPNLGMILNTSLIIQLFLSSNGTHYYDCGSCC